MSYTKTGVISLLYKKGDPTNIENWRPITLLHVDYRIVAKVPSLRLQKVISKIISTDQQGYVKNRFIGYNLRQIQDIIDYADEVQSESAIIFLDFRKAYDTIEWPFLFSSLKHFGFKDDLIAWIQTLYKYPSLYIYNNG